MSAESVTSQMHYVSLPYGAEYFTGIRPSNRLTVANYLGAIIPMLSAQSQIGEVSGPGRPLVFIADLHAHTDQPAGEVVANREEVIWTYLALGLDPTKTDIFVQSQIADRVFMVTMALSRLMTLSQVERVPTLKDKINDPGQASMYLAMYPLIMAADIALQLPKIVPTGRDQRAHLEVARDLIDRVNHLVGFSLLPLPSGGDGVPINILGLRGSGKMSKTRPEHALFLDDSPEVITEKIRRAQTAQAGVESPHLANLVLIGAELSTHPSDASELRSLYEEHLDSSSVAAKIKLLVTRIVVEFTQEYQARREKVRLDPELVRSAVADGGRRAADNADKTIEALASHGISLPSYEI